MSRNNVLVALADKNFINQAKQLFSTVYWNSGWAGDFCLLAYNIPESELAWFTDKGILVKKCDPLDVKSPKIGDKITACKIYLFDKYFKKWNNVIYLDVDIVTRGSILGILDNLSGFSACYSLGQTLEDNLIDFSNIPSIIIDELRNNFDLQTKAFNSGVMAFPTSIITEKIQEDLLATFNKYVLYGSFGGDQLPFNIFFYNMWTELPPSYNQITPLSSKNYKTDKLKGLIIHCVSFANGPWDQDSLFYDEWRDNLNKSDYIDLNDIPSVPEISKNDLLKRDKSVVQAYILDGTFSLQTLFKRTLTAISLIANPSKLYMKIQSLINRR